MNHTAIWSSFLIFFLLITASGFSQEICDNALDDDLDGLIDLNDPDCDCPIIEPVSLIPNPSFEDMTCCPNNRSEMNCAIDWIQASGPTTDYLHTCGWLGWQDLPVPLPIPDGDGCIGFRNGRFGGGGTNANWKEYAGACLTRPLRATVDYKFQFYIGFTNGFNSPNTNIAFYGSTSCVNLPFGNNDVTFGCPTNGPNWIKLGEVPVSGANTWKLAEINVTPNQDIRAIAIGPDCFEITSSVATYYFFDNLVLADEESFLFDIQPTEHICGENVSLGVPYNDSISYQWYKEGIALVGETAEELSSMYGEGNYQVRLMTPSLQCRISKVFTFERPVFINETTITICEGQSFQVGDSILTQSTSFIDTLKTADNCDSIQRLNLRVYRDKGDTIRAKIYPSELYKIEKVFYAYPGIYSQLLQTPEGCDSTLILVLDYYEIFKPNAFTPNGDGYNDFFSISGGIDLVNIQSFTIYNRWGKQMLAARDWEPGNLNVGWDGKVNGRNQPEGVYVYVAEVVFDDGKPRTVSGTFTLLR